MKGILVSEEEISRAITRILKHGTLFSVANILFLTPHARQNGYPAFERLHKNFETETFLFGPLT